MGLLYMQTSPGKTERVKARERFRSGFLQQEGRSLYSLELCVFFLFGWKGILLTFIGLESGVSFSKCLTTELLFFDGCQEFREKLLKVIGDKHEDVSN